MSEIAKELIIKAGEERGQASSAASLCRDLAEVEQNTADGLRKFLDHCVDVQRLMRALR